MKLFKNVDISDLESILENGILSLNASQNDNWESGRRSDNSRDVVYLFNPISEINSFTNYGAALIEVNVDGAERNEMSHSDVHRGEYEEYIISEVPADQIVAIYIPELFKSRIELPDCVSPRITWCKMVAKYWAEGIGKIECPDDVLQKFAATASVSSSTTFNYFRGTNDDRTMIDLYDVQYVLS